MNASDVTWQLQVEGGIFGLITHTVNGAADIAIGESQTVGTRMLFGFGNIQITVKVEDVTKKVNGAQLFIFTLLKQ